MNYIPNHHTLILDYIGIASFTVSLAANAGTLPVTPERNLLYSKDRVKHDSFRVFNAFVTRFSCFVWNAFWNALTRVFRVTNAFPNSQSNRHYSNAKKTRLAQISRRKYQPIRNIYLRSPMT